MDHAFETRNLFSTYFLTQRFPQLDRSWAESLEGSASTLQKIRELFANVRPDLHERYRHNEANLEQHFIRPVLDILGHSYDVQETWHFQYRGSERPDYTLFESEEIRRAVSDDRDRYVHAATGLAEAKAWDVSLDRTIQLRPGLRANPSDQINNYLRDSNRRWGILTNGRKWRLYTSQTSRQLDSYYEVDLPELLSADDPSQFRYFYFFFRSQAFKPGPSSRSALDDVYDQSIHYARELENDVRESVYTALKLLVQGFLRHPDNSLSPSRIREIHQNSLILLYRLLFVLYSEAKGLLPLDKPAYHATSLASIRDEVRLDAKSASTRYMVGGDSIWARLKGIFSLINSGSVARGVSSDSFFIPSYNGGLFDPGRYPFLERYRVGDTDLAAAIDQLSFRPGHLDDIEGFVDYGTLSIRHLGSIHEGLLEYIPEVATVETVVVPDEGRLVFMPRTAMPPAMSPSEIRETYAPGEVFLTTHKGERRASGSYYTPDHVVRHIVESTLTPVVNSVLAKADSASDRVSALLSIKILDPAMGSGHFLVEATSYLAEKVVEVASVEGLLAPTGSDSDILSARREVVRRCIFGVDVNPLAVELAKVSLWLHTLTSDKPLSFLDHHLKCGDSLIHSDLRDLPWYPASKDDKNPRSGPGIDWVGARAFVDPMLSLYDELTSTPDDSVDLVKSKERLFEKIRTQAQFLRIKALCDVRVGVYFGAPISDGQYHNFARHVYHGDEDEWKEDRSRNWFHSGVNHARDLTSFHWDLEFPEAFVSGGFDVVIGNPPYDVLAEKERGENLELLLRFFRSRHEYQNALGGKLDLYRLFVARAFRLVRPRGYVSFVVPVSLLADQYTEHLRRFLLTGASLLRVDAFPQKDDPSKRIFLEAKLGTCIFVAKATRGNTEQIRILTHPGNRFEEVAGDYSALTEEILALDPETGSIPLCRSEEDFHLAVKLATSANLTRANRRIHSFQGEINEKSLAKYTSTDPAVGPRILRGGNVQRYRFVAQPKQGVPKFLEVERWKRDVAGERSAHPDHPRLGYQRNAALDNWRRLIVCRLPTPCYCFDSVSYVPQSPGEDLDFWLALLNSKLFEWRFRLTSTNNHVSVAEIGAMPVWPNPGVETRNQFRSMSSEALRRLCQSRTPAQVDSWVAERLKLGHLGLAQVETVLAQAAVSLNLDYESRERGVVEFLSWIRQQLGSAQIPSEFPQTLQRHLPAPLSFDKFIDLLRASNVIRRRTVLARPVMDALRAEYERMLQTFLETQHNIELLEWLVNRIIYKAVGLENREVELIESIIAI